MYCCVWFFVTPWTAAHQAPLSMGFPGKNTGMGCHFLLQGGSSWPRNWNHACWQADSLPLRPWEVPGHVLATSIPACVGLSSGSSSLLLKFPLWKPGDKNSRRWSTCAPPNLGWGRRSQCLLSVSWAPRCHSASLVVRWEPMACTWMRPVFSTALECSASESTPSCLLPQHFKTTFPQGKMEDLGKLPDPFRRDVRGRHLS